MIPALNNLSVGTVSSVGTTSTARATVGAASGGTQAAVTRISPQAELLGKLSALKASDPAQFTATLTKMADEVRTKAKTASTTDAAHLNDFADKLTAAAKSGDLSALQADAGASGGKPAGGRPAGGPHGPPPGGGAPAGGGGGGGGATKSSSKSGASDPADTNGDGTVSAAEKAVYALTHSASSSNTDDASATNG